MKKFYDKGGSVLVPQAPTEPDERIDKMTGLPYDLQAGGAFVDEEDRLGFSAAGLVKIIQRLRRSPREAVTDARPTTRIEGEDAAKETLRDFRYRQPKNFIDPNDPRLNIIAVKPDKEGTFVKYLDEEEGMTLDSFSRSTDKDEIIRNYQLSNPENEFVDIQYTPQNIYYNRRAEVEDRLAKELDDELNAIPVEDEGIVREYLQAIPRVSEKSPINADLTKEEFLKGSKETNPQFHGKFFGSVQYDNELASNLPRELGMHIGTKGQSENIVMRRVNPILDKLIEDKAKFDYMKRGLAKTEDEAAVLVKDKGVPDKIYDDIKEEFLDSVPTGVDPQIREGFINVKNPLVLDIDMINWNPAKFLGGYDPEGKLKLAEQADSFVAALDAQVKLPPERFTEIINSRAEEINFFIRKKEMNSGELLNDIYDYQINIATRSMLEDLGFDSIQYKNLGELARVSEKQAGGHSYILFRDDQFVTDFVPAPRQAADDSGVQFTSEEYDAAFKQFDNIDDVEEWQNAVKSYVKSDRKINPDVRTPELEKSAQDFLAGKINREQHLQNIDTHKPVRPFTSLPKEPSDKSLIFSHGDTTRLNGNFLQVDDPSFFNKTFVHKNGIEEKIRKDGKIVKTGNYIVEPGTEFNINKSNLAVGDKFNGRLQIPSYKEYDSWVIAGKGGSDKGTTYAKALWYEGKDGKPVRLIAKDTQGEKIATGKEGKTGYATIAGWIKSTDVDEIRREADRLVDKGNWTVGEARDVEDWTQSGFDPRRQTQFYVREVKDQHIPIIQGDEVIQIGPLVLVKNAVLDKGYQGLATGGRVLRSLGRTRRTEGGKILGSLHRHCA